MNIFQQIFLGTGRKHLILIQEVLFLSLIHISFANVYLWSRQYPVKWAIVEDALVFKSEDENHLAFAYPAGEPENVKKALEVRCV